MSERKYILIDPVTRVEGEAKVVVVLEGNMVKEVYYEILATRGFESFCRGRAVEELPRITSTICGVCSWAHHVASGKTLDMLLGREPTITAKKIRELAYYMQIIDSHLLHFSVMALPDLVLPDSDPMQRNIAGLMQIAPDLTMKILKSRNIIKAIEKIFGGKPIHAAFMMPGGVSKSLKEEDVKKLREHIGELKEIIVDVVDFFDKKILNSEVYQKYLYDDAYMLKTYYMSIIGENNKLEFYDGLLRIIDPEGREVATFKPEEYTEYIAEHFSNWTYAKFPYLKKIGWKGFVEPYIVRAGPLARLNIIDKVPTERAGEEYEKMIETLGKPIHNTMAYHWARIIEIMYSIERMEEMINDPDILSDDRINLEGEPKYEGVGVIEAPRGTLIHHYKSNEQLITTDVNFITPTTINNTAINAELKKVVEKVIGNSNDKIDHKTINKIEISIRAYDPCNSCAAHTIFLTSDNVFKILLFNIDTGEKIVKEYKII